MTETPLVPYFDFLGIERLDDFNFAIVSVFILPADPALGNFKATLRLPIRVTEELRVADARDWAVELAKATISTSPLLTLLSRQPPS